MEVFFASVGGARPKAVVRMDDREWIAKFPSVNDRFNVPLIERATLELAREAGLDVPRTGIESLADDRQVMLIERFDRVPLPSGIGRRHMVSALTLLALHEQDSSYAAMADALGQHGVGGYIARDRGQRDRKSVV